MEQMFLNRMDAANQMAEKLVSYKGCNPLVLAVPRGAVPMGRLIAESLDGELDVVLVKKIGAPGQPEYALGAVNEHGWVFTPENVCRQETLLSYVEKETAHKLALCQELRRQYTPLKLPVNPSGRTVIVVDDGMATGSTMVAALNSVRAQKPAKLICAVPVAHPDALNLVRKFADHVVCIMESPWFFSVGQFYRDFSQVSDDEVREILRG